MYSDCILVLQKEASFRNIDLPCEFCMGRMFHHTEHAEDSKDTKCPLCERESQSLFTYSHTSARTVCLSLGGVKANVLGQRRTVTEQMLLAECVTHSNLANFPAEICVQLSHGFASFNHFCVFKHLQMLEDRIVERNKEEKSTGGGGWWHCPQFSCTSRKGGEAISPSQTLNSANSLHLCLKAHRSCLETLSSKILFSSILR